MLFPSLRVACFSLLRRRVVPVAAIAVSSREKRVVEGALLGRKDGFDRIPGSAVEVSHPGPVGILELFVEVPLEGQEVLQDLFDLDALHGLQPHFVDDHLAVFTLGWFLGRGVLGLGKHCLAPRPRDTAQEAGGDGHEE